MESIHLTIEIAPAEVAGVMDGKQFAEFCRVFFGRIAEIEDYQKPYLFAATTKAVIDAIYDVPSGKMMAETLHLDMLASSISHLTPGDLEWVMDKAKEMQESRGYEEETL